MKSIFISYRQDDNPGYVKQLANDLVSEYGSNQVFRDVDDITSGEKWKSVIQQRLEDSAVVLAVIGPKWEEIWRNRLDNPDDVLRFELNLAEKLNIPIIPVSLNGTKLSPDIDLKELSWLTDIQTYDLSDRQGRWNFDVEQLIKRLRKILELATPKPEPSSSKLKWVAGLIGLFLILVVWSALTPKETPFPREDNGGMVLQPSYDLTGTWIGQDGTTYIIKQHSDSTFAIQSPGYGNGLGKIVGKNVIANLPGIGSGEYELSEDGQSIAGWFTESDSGEREYDVIYKK